MQGFFICEEDEEIGDAKSVTDGRRMEEHGGSSLLFGLGYNARVCSM